MDSDRRVVVNAWQAGELLASVTYVGGCERASGRRLRAFFGCLYYAAMCPGEALGLRLSDRTLPKKGWGRIDLAETRPTAGKAWTDSGEAHDRRGLKQRADGEVRIVPIPPPLVRMLQEHIKEFGNRGRRPAVLQRAGQRDRRLVVLARMEASTCPGAPTRTGRLCPGGSPVRPPARGCLPVAQLGRSRTGGGGSRRPLGGRSSEDLRQVHRRPGAGDERPDPEGSRRRGRPWKVTRLSELTGTSLGVSGPTQLFDSKYRSSLDK